jgi:DNA-binding transcriptional LysR family regulator
MELRQLRYFVAVADDLNFTKAARKLRVAQPALSRQIRQLEEEIGVPLFDRTPRSVSLTEAGKTFLPEARCILALSANAMRAAQATKQNGRASLNIGYAWGLFHSLVPAAVARFHRKLPDVAVNLFDMTAPQQTAALMEGRLDIGFIGFAKDAAAPGLARRKIGSCSLLLALPQNHRATRRRTVNLGELAQEFFCVISDQNFPGAAQCAIEACASAGFRPKILETAARGNIQLGLVAANCGVALMPEPLAALPHAGVVFRPLNRPYTSDLFAVWDARHSVPMRHTFLNSVL